MFSKTGQKLFLVGMFILLACLSGCAADQRHDRQNTVLAPPPNADPKAVAALMEGNRLFSERQWTAAIRKYEKAIQLQPTLAEAHYNLGWTLYSKGEFKDARPHFIEAATLAPAHPVIRNAPPFRRYEPVAPAPPEKAFDGHMGHQH